MTTEPEPIEIRLPVVVRALVLAFGVVWCVLAVPLVVDAVREGPSLAVVACGLLGFGILLVSRLLRLGVRADERGLRVRNHWGTRVHEWDDVDEFRLGRPAGVPFRRVVHVVLGDGEVDALEVTAGRGARQLDGVLEQLRAWLPP